MLVFGFAITVLSLNDNDLLVSQELVDQINNNPKKSFKAKLYPQFAHMTIKDAKRFLSPIRSNSKRRGSPTPVGTNEKFFDTFDHQFITGLTEIKYSSSNEYLKDPVREIPVFNVGMLCSSWAPAVTSAVSISVSRWYGQFVNFSLQFIIDCDPLGDACIEREPLSAYQMFLHSAKVPEYNSWDKAELGGRERTDPLQAPRSDFTYQDHCIQDACYPGTTNCIRNYALTGSCESGQIGNLCPIYYLYNWRSMKIHLFEVGAITSSIIVYPSLFTYNAGVYSGDGETQILGMLDVTIIGWGQSENNLSSNTEKYNATTERWWYVIPHLGCSFGIGFSEINSAYLPNDQSLVPTGPNCAEGKGLMKFNRRFDDCFIESNSVGAVPFNFIPRPWRTPEPTI